MISEGIIEAAIPIINLQNLNATEHIIWCLGNLAGDSLDIRSIMHNYNIHEIIVDFLQVKDLHFEVLEVCFFTLSNLMRNYLPSLTFMDHLLKTIKVVMRNKGPKITSDCLFILSYISNGSREHVNILINSGILSEMMPLLNNLDIKIQYPAIKTCANVVSENTFETQYMLNLKILDYLAISINSLKKKIRKESLFALSNIAAGTKSQVAQVVDHIAIKNAMKKLTDKCPLVRKEATMVFSNIVHAGSYESILKLVMMKLLDWMVHAFATEDIEIIQNLVDICKGICEANEYASKCSWSEFNATKEFEESGIVNALEECYHDLSDNEKVQSEISRILELYFEYDFQSVDISSAEPVQVFTF